ncbi:hypothetical protein [Mycoplasmopsis californica]|nr:hypothetical protein [Mycoplasmopsis californica]
MNNKTKKILRGSSIGLAVCAITGITAFSIAYKANNPFKPTFYNYKSYMSDDGKDVMNKHFDYKEFETLNEFTRAIMTNKAMAGIGSDSQAVQLIRRGKLKEIDYLKLFQEDNNRPEWAKNKTYQQYRDSAEYRMFQKNLFTDLTWKHMSAYDQILKTDFDNKPWADGRERHLYDYFVPYFTQDMVIGYNPVKVDPSLQDADLNTPEGRKKLYLTDQKILKTLGETGQNKGVKSDKKEVLFKDALSALKKHGFNRWQITDAVRDNMIYGSAYSHDKDGKIIPNIISGEAGDIQKQPELYKKYIDNFANLIKDGLGYELTNPNIQLLGDGQLILTNLITDQSNANASIMYNGDASDAYFSDDNDVSVANGTIRFIRPRSNLLLIDGLVVVNSDLVTEEQYDKLYNTAKEAFLHGLQYKSWDKFSTKEIEEFPSYKNFDFVTYTPAVKVLYDYALNNKFSDLDPYEQQYAKQLYEIKSDYSIIDPITGEKMFDYKVDHTAIQPTDQKTQTNLITYWNQKTKK